MRMTSLKRKASQELARNSVPLDELIPQRNTMSDIKDMLSRVAWWCKSWFISAPTASHQVIETTPTHTQSTTTKEDGSTSLKRQKIRDIPGPRSKSAGGYRRTNGHTRNNNRGDSARSYSIAWSRAEAKRRALEQARLGIFSTSNNNPQIESRATEESTLRLAEISHDAGIRVPKLELDGCVTSDDFANRAEAFWAPPPLGIYKNKQPQFDDGHARQGDNAQVADVHIQDASTGSDREEARRHSDPDVSPWRLSNKRSSRIEVPENFKTIDRSVETQKLNDVIAELLDLKTDETSNTPLQPSRRVLTRRAEKRRKERELAEEHVRKQREAEKRAAEEKARIEREAAAKRAKEEAEAAAIAARAIKLERIFPKKPFIIPLDAKWESAVAKTLSARHGQEITIAPSGTPLSLNEFQRLLGHGSWLNDEVVNAYIDTIVNAANDAYTEELKARGEKPGSVPRFMAHSSFFYQDLMKKGPEGSVRLMRRKKAPGKSILEIDTLIIPILVGDNHWTLGVIRPIAKTIEYLDSFGGQGSAFIKNMKGWLAHHLKDAYIEEEWKVVKSTCVQQTNGYDCGVFVCTNALCVVAGFDTTSYDGDSMSIQRKRIGAVLLNKGFTGDFAWKRLVAGD